MRTIFIASFLAALTICTGLAVSQANAQDNVCFRLWVARNSIFKANGYCFKTARAIAYFGNAGCQYDYEADVPMSPYDRQRVAQIQAEERALGCR
jgi:phosphopantetheinyl transferase